MNSVHTNYLFYQPYKEGIKNVKKAFAPTDVTLDNSKLSQLTGRVFHFIAGISLFIPGVNTIIFLALKYFSKEEQNPLEETPSLENRIIEPQDNLKETKAKRVSFGEVRGRIFEKENSPEDISNINSVTLNDMSKKTELSEIVIESERETEDPIGIERKIPPISCVDTVNIDMINGKISSIHGIGHFIKAEEIISYGQVVHSERMEEVLIEYTAHGKAIIQQQATRGCTAAVTAMLIKDNNKNPDIKELCERNLGQDKDKIRDIQLAGLMPLSSKIASTENRLSELKKLLQENGSAIVSVGGELGAHVVVVDDVAEDLKSVRIREPYHGWEITITDAAFLKRWLAGEKDTIFQVKK